MHVENRWLQYVVITQANYFAVGRQYARVTELDLRWVDHFLHSGVTWNADAKNLHA